MKIATSILLILPAVFMPITALASDDGNTLKETTKGFIWEATKVIN